MPLHRSSPCSRADLVEVQPDHEGEAEDQERLVAVLGEEALDRLDVRLVVLVEHVDVVAAEVRHAEHAGAAGAERAPVLEHAVGVDHQHRQPLAGRARSCSVRAERAGLGGRGVLVEVDPADAGAGGAAARSATLKTSSSGMLLSAWRLEQPDRQPRQVVDGPKSAPAASPTATEDPVVRLAVRPVVLGQLVELGQQRPPRFSRLAERRRHSYATCLQRPVVDLAARQQRQRVDRAHVEARDSAGAELSRPATSRPPCRCPSSAPSSEDDDLVAGGHGRDRAVHRRAICSTSSRLTRTPNTLAIRLSRPVRKRKPSSSRWPRSPVRSTPPSSSPSARLGRASRRSPSSRSDRGRRPRRDAGSVVSAPPRADRERAAGQRRTGRAELLGQPVAAARWPSAGAASVWPYITNIRPPTARHPAR